MPPAGVRVRFAPSPTGDPHIGNAYAALYNMAMARRHGGAFILRIEDTDRTRYSPDSERRIFESLRWLGIAWDEGPDVGGPVGPYRQSERLPIYRAHADQLLARGAAYLCFCTPDRLDWMRKDQMRRGVRVGYDGHCRVIPPGEAAEKRAAGEPCVVRLAVPRDGETAFHDIPRGRIVFRNETVDDQVLLKTDGFPTYHLANVVDDHLMGITHIIRAEEWLSSVPKHVLLYKAFGWEVPAMCHLPLLRNADRTKLSKRKNPTSIAWYREQGFLPEAVVNFLALMGSAMVEGKEEAEVFSLSEWIAAFDLTKVGVTGPVFDLAKLEWLNGMYLRRLPPEDLARRLAEEGFAPASLTGQAFARILPLVQDRLKRLSQFAALSAFFFEPPGAVDSAVLVPKGRDIASTARALDGVAAAWRDLAEWSAGALEAAAVAVMASLGWKKGEIFMLIRVAITGKTATPPICETCVALGRDETLRRLDAARAGLDRAP